MYRRIMSAIAAMVISVTCLMAQNTQGTALDKLCSALSHSCVCLDCDYSFDMSEIRFQTEADIKVQGRAYVVDGAGMLVYSDGETVWTVDPNIKEVYIQSSGNELLNDPAIFFQNLDKYFKVTEKKVSDGVEVYSLNAVEDCGVKSAELTLKPDGTIVSAVIGLSDGGKMDVKVRSMKVEEKKSVTFFRPSMSFDEAWIVTDLR